MVLSESEYSHQALSDVIPLRDVFGLLFFVSVGMLLDPAFLLANLGTVLLVVALVAAGKALIFGGVARAFGYSGPTALAIGLGLFQIGEFAFVLARVGLAQGIITPDHFALILATAVSTMVLTPFATRLVDPLSAWLARRSHAAVRESFHLPEAGLRDHIVIVGYGQVGRYSADVLQRLSLPCVVIDQDQQAVDQARAAGLPVIYGDASSTVVLEAADIHTARLALVVVAAAIDVELVVRAVRVLNPGLHIVARAARLAQIEHLRRFGIYEIVQPEFEAGLELVRQTLLHFDMPAIEIDHLSDAVRTEYYQPFQSLDTNARLLGRLQRARGTIEIEWLTLPADAPFAGQSIADSGIREHTGASVAALQCDDALQSNPAPSTLLAAGQRIAIMGTPEQRAAFRAWLGLAAGADTP
jgi:CPA2 family monovalent cation:H+ antiporter-2